MRETEVLFFLIVVIMIRSRKTGNVSMINYLTSGFMYAKCANLILFFMSDPRLGLVYSLLFLLQGLLLPEPTYKGPENIVYFRDNNITEHGGPAVCGGHAGRRAQGRGGARQPPSPLPAAATPHARNARGQLLILRRLLSFLYRGLP